MGFATGGHHLVVARLGEGKDKRTDDDDCHLVYDMSGATKKETLSPRDYCDKGFSREPEKYV